MFGDSYAVYMKHSSKCSCTHISYSYVPGCNVKDAVFIFSCRVSARCVSHLHIFNAKQSSSNLYTLCLECIPSDVGADMTMPVARHQTQFYQLPV